MIKKGVGSQLKRNSYFFYQIGNCILIAVYVWRLKKKNPVNYETDFRIPLKYVAIFDIHFFAIIPATEINLFFYYYNGLSFTVRTI